MPSAAGAAEESEPLTAAEASDATCPGLCRPTSKRFTPPKTAKLFLALAWTEGALAIAFAIYTLIHSDNLSLHEYSTLAILLMVAFGYFATNSIYAENVFQLFAAVFVSIMYTGFVAFKYSERDTWGAFWVKWAGTVLGVKLGFEAAYLALCFPVYKRFGYRIFKVVGADEHMQSMYRTYLTFLSLIKADFVVGILLVTMSWFFFEVSTLELVLEVTALAVTLVWAAATWAMVVLETAAALRFSILFAAAEPAFVVYKLLQLFVLNGERLRTGATPGQFAVVGGIALILRALLVEYLVTASRNFGRGLRRKVFARQRSKPMAEYKEGTARRSYHATA